MKLVEAFLRLGPVAADAPASVCADHGQAASVILDTLLELAASLRANPAEREEAVSETIFRLVRGGPRDPGPGGEASWTEARVRGYLSKALRNNLSTIRQARRREQALVEEPAAPAPDSGGDRSDGGTAEAPAPDHALLVALRGLLDGPVLDHAADSMRASAREAFLRSVVELWDLALETCTMADVQAARAALDGPKVGVNTIHQHHTRARRRLGDAIEALARRGDLSRETADRLLRLVEGLRRRG